MNLIVLFVMPGEAKDNRTLYNPQEYDTNINNTIPYYSSIHQEIINLVKALPSETRVWMDTGCGTGNLVEKAANDFPDTKFLLLDPSESMLKISKEKLASFSRERMKFLEASPTQKFSRKLEEKPDIVTAIQCHHYLNSEERAKAVKVCYDLLENDGAFITFENIRPLTDNGTKIGQKYWENFLLSRGRTEGDIEKYLARFDVEYFPLTVEEHLELLREAGFRTVELFWYSYMQAGFYCIK